ncbi:MAG: ABC transporter permease [Firmicutes bacterium]|nr:ABC transporter permease [Bacillota bacterium]
MNLYSIALNNIARRKKRMLLILFGLMTGIAITVALFMIVESMRLALGDQIDEFGANIVIVPRAEGMDISYGGTNVTRASVDINQLTESDLELISTIPDYNSINLISPKLVAAVSANDRDVILVGVQPEREFIMKPWFSLSDQAGLPAGASPDDLALIKLAENSLIAGADTARKLMLEAGDEVIVNGTLFIIAAVISPLGSVEDGLLYGNLDAVQNLLGRQGEISMIEISAYCNTCPIEDIAAQLSEAIPGGRVTALRQAALLREETINKFSTFSILISTVVLIIAALLVLTTTMASVHERTREIGIFRAIGFRGSNVLTVILLEAGITGLSGGIIGYVVGSIIALNFGSYLTGNNIPVFWQANLIAPAMLLALLITITAAAYPAYRAASLDPAEALRFI